MDMGHILEFIVISSIEYIALMAFIFTMFRIRFNHLKIQILFIALSLSYISFSMRTDDFPLFTPIVQPVLIFLLIWMIIKIHPYYSAVISVVGYLCYGLIQSVFMYLFVYLLSWPLYVTALSTAATFFGISLWLKRKNIGFSFVPTSEFVRNRIKTREMAMFLTTIISSIAGATFAYTYTVVKNEPLYFFLTLLILVISVGMLFLLSNQREKEGFYD